MFQQWNFFNFCSFHTKLFLPLQEPSRTFRELCHPNPKIKQRNAFEKAQNPESSKDTIYGSLSLLFSSSKSNIVTPTHTLNSSTVTPQYLFSFKIENFLENHRC